MSNFNPEKLYVEFENNITYTSPIIPRLYTLTHSDETGDLFLYIGQNYNLNKITSFRDEVLARWIKLNGKYVLSVDLYVGGSEFDFINQSKRYDIFNKELPLALKAIIYGDNQLFKTYPELNNSEIIVTFHSIYPVFNSRSFWGYINDYKS